MNMKLLIVDDDLPFRERLSRSMEKKGFDVTSSPGFKDSLVKVNENNFDYAVVDMRLEDGSGLELVKELQKISPQTKSLLLTGYGNIATAVAAIKSGAIDYLPKPAEIDQIYDALTNSKEALPPPPETSCFPFAEPFYPSPQQPFLAFQLPSFSYSFLGCQSSPVATF